MKFLSAVVFFLICFFSFQVSCAQDTAIRVEPDPNSLMQDTTVFLEGSFVVRNPYAVKDSIAAFRIWASRMRDTTVDLDPSFIVLNVYAAKDSLAAFPNGPLSKRDSLRKVINDSLRAIGSALMHTADMQDTVVVLEPSFVVRDTYARRDSLKLIHDSLLAVYAQAATMQDTVIEIDPSFTVMTVYAQKDFEDAKKDSVKAIFVQAATMQDTVVEMDPSFKVVNVYLTRDRLEAVRDSLAWPTLMHDTVVAIDSSFVIRDLYPFKDSVQAVRDSIVAITDSLFADSVSRHWAGWKDYEVKPERPFTINARTTLKGKSREELEYNIADFYLSLNGEPVSPAADGNNFFPAACLGFKFDDTLLLNSGLGFKVGIGVGIKIIQGKFTSTLHANKHNTEIYKLSEDDSVYLTSIVAEPVTQSLVFKYFPTGSRNEILIGEYQASYKKFYEKDENDQDQPRHYTVRIVFKCRITGGINSN